MFAAVADDDGEINDRPVVRFDTCVVPHGGSARVRGRSEGGWVFCGLERGCGEYMRVAGGRVEYVAGFSGDDCDVEFIITHDGTASTVVVTFNSRAD